MRIEPLIVERVKEGIEKAQKFGTKSGRAIGRPEQLYIDTSMNTKGNDKWQVWLRLTLTFQIGLQRGYLSTF